MTDPMPAQLALDVSSISEFEARSYDILAGRGPMPTHEELQAGQPFLRGSLIMDVQTYIATELLDENLDPAVRAALELASANPMATTMRAAADAIEGTTSHVGRRLDLYAAWLGDPIGRDRTIRRGFENQHNKSIAQVFRPPALAAGLTQYSRRHDAGDVTTDTVNATVARGADRLGAVLDLHQRYVAARDRHAELDGDGETASGKATTIDSAMARIAALSEDRAEVDDAGALVFDDGIPPEYEGLPHHPAKPTLMVVPGLDPKGGNSNTRDNRKSWVGIAGKRLPLVEAEDVADIAADLVDRWPHAKDVIHVILGDLALGGPIRFRPTLLVGEPGCGKTALLRAIADEVGLESEVYSLAGMADASMMGTSAQWSTSRESVPLQLIKRAKTANGAIIWDELEKIGTRTENGNALEAMLPYLEKHTASRMRDLCLEVEVDLSMISHFATANSVTDIPAPLKDRMRILRMPDPTWEHLGTLVGQIVDDIAEERGIDPRWYPALAEDEIDVIKGAWPGGSLRRLRMAIQILLDGRDSIAARA